MIKVLLKNATSLEEKTLPGFETLMGIQWQNELAFASEKIIQTIHKKSKRALLKKEITMRQKWLGFHFQKQILEGFLPDISVRWINDAMGYGVFTEKKIFPADYIGEYTGLVRKRVGRIDQKNDYCFEYSIGDWVYNPFIIDAKSQGNFTRFINHSADPNIEPICVCVDDVMHIIFMALKEIQEGTQLFYQYGDYFWKKRSKPLEFSTNKQ